MAIRADGTLGRMTLGYETEQPSRADADRLPGTTVLEFGTNWCGYCRASKRYVDAALDGRADVRHVMVEDGPGRPLGRSFRVKLWPTLIVLKDGVEVARAVRPMSTDAITDALDQAAPTSSAG